MIVSYICIRPAYIPITILSRSSQQWREHCFVTGSSCPAGCQHDFLSILIGVQSIFSRRFVLLSTSTMWSITPAVEGSKLLPHGATYSKIISKLLQSFFRSGQYWGQYFALRSPEVIKGQISRNSIYFRKCAVITETFIARRPRKKRNRAAHVREKEPLSCFFFR